MRQPAVCHFHARNALGLGNLVPLVQRLECRRLVILELVQLSEKPCLVPAALERLIAELLRRLGEEAARDGTVRHKRNVVLAQNGEQLRLGQTRNGVVAALEHGGNDKAFALAYLNNLLDLLARVVGNAKPFEDALFVKTVNGSKRLFEGDACIRSLQVQNVDLRVGK